jgi:hypothetical protein
MNPRHFLALLVGIAATAGASAQSVESFDVVFANINSPIVANASDTIALPEFDTNLGTLLGVSLTLNSTLVGYAKVFDIGSGTGTFSDSSADFSSSGNNITLAGPAGLTEIANPVITGFSGTVGAGSFLLSSGISRSFLVTVSDSNLLQYEAAGGGNLGETLTLSGLGTFSGTQIGSQQVFFGGEATASGDLSVKYTFEAIPEPPTYALIVGVAAFGLVLLRRHQHGIGLG